jgi:hypothetical protein
MGTTYNFERESRNACENTSLKVFLENQERMGDIIDVNVMECVLIVEDGDMWNRITVWTV